MRILKTAILNSFRNLFRNRTVNGLSLSIISFTLIIFGFFNYLSYNISEFTKNFSKNVEAIFYLKDNYEKQSIEELIKKIRQNPIVEKTIFRTGSQAAIEFSMDFPELKHILSEFTKPPFPSSIDVTFKYSEDNTKIISFIKEIEHYRMIESKQLNIDWADKVNKVRKLLSFLGMFLSVILIFISSFIIFNVIKINIFYRKDEIEIFKLVGATNMYIKTPFIIEGAALGLFGSIFSSLLLYMIIKLAPQYASSLIELSKGVLDFNYIPAKIFLEMIILGITIGLFSSYFSIRKYISS